MTTEPAPFDFSPTVHHRRLMKHMPRTMAFADLQRIYDAFDAADRCRLVVGPAGHRFYAEPAWTALLGLINGVTPGPA